MRAPSRVVCRRLGGLSAAVARERVRVRVPATSANMGPGFDCLGIALTEHNLLAVERARAFSIEIVGEGADSLPRDESNFYYRAFKLGFAASAPAGAPIPPVKLTCTNAIPPARGLGSSSACLVAGVTAGFALNGHDARSGEIRDRVFQICAEQEGHPDNVAPAIYGGLQLSFLRDERGHFLTQRIPIHADARGATAVLFVPDFELPTKEARALLKPEVSRADAVFNIARAATIVHAFSSGRLPLLRWGAQDRLHQPQRGALFPLFKLIDAATGAGAHGAWLSGAGPTVCAMVGGASGADGARGARDAIDLHAPHEVGRAMVAAAKAAAMSGRLVMAQIDDAGVELDEV
ncbi:hypothetical protein KFE25_010819 [Diacronema lutheri]|uniref:Homoserine kinase n=2 Tax=Diacronema lutheri TaxID=2081491 RepID=A0A8J6C545_DIALT|nr:hypothetical protein KFE25_010819 [Diacronema lutheri]